MSIGLHAGRPSANRKPDPKTIMADDDQKRVRINVEVTESERQKLKIYAAKTGQTISDIIRASIRQLD